MTLIQIRKPNPIQLWLGDCLEEMSRIPGGSIDLILTDLPYGTTVCKWDIIIPFDSLWKEYKRVVKPKGAILLFGSQPFTSLMIGSNLKMFRQELIWEKKKGTDFLNANRRILKVHENMILFSNGLTTYNPQKEKGIEYTRPAIRTKRVTNNNGGHVAALGKISDGMRFPKSVLRFSTPLGIHDTQKPTPLLEYLIRTYSNEGELVLDSCMGSGSTAIACMNTCRNFIGIEKDATIYATAKQRIAAHRKGIKL